MKERTWLKGDTHLHTINSDGWLTKGQLVERCKNDGLDFAIITDHNYNTVEKAYFDDDLLVMQGQEITDELGHINVWGKKVPIDPPYVLQSEEDYKKVLEPSRKKGAVLSVNHPFCSMCGFHMDLEAFGFDCVEVWNTIQHSDNVKNMNWWHNQLLKGNKIAAVGGSDFHHDYFKVLKLMAVPTTIVHTTGKTESEILKAICEGRSVVTNDPKASMIYLTCGDYNIGDTVKWGKGIKVNVQITDLKKGHTVKIYNNDKVIFEEKSNTNADIFSADIEVLEAGFVRCEITYTFNPVMKELYKTVECKYLSADIKSLPPFFWAFTNPIWFE